MESLWAIIFISVIAQLWANESVVMVVKTSRIWRVDTELILLRIMLNLFSSTFVDPFCLQYYFTAMERLMKLHLSFEWLYDDLPLTSCILSLALTLSQLASLLMVLASRFASICTRRRQTTCTKEYSLNSDQCVKNKTSEKCNHYIIILYNAHYIDVVFIHW